MGIVRHERNYPQETSSLVNEKSDEDYDDGYMIVDFSLWILTIILGVAVVFVTCNQAIDIVKCLTFPEMYVFEYISALVK